MLKIIKLTLALFVVLFFSTCKKECCQDPTNPKCENYDPCKAKSKVLATFKSFVYLYGPNSEVYTDAYREVDTLGLGGTIDFISDNQNYKSYEWIIGTDPKRRFGKQISMSFNFTSEQTVPITLIVEGSAEKNCQNKQDFRDTFTKYIHFTHLSKLALNGKYRGAFTNDPNKIFDVNIYILDNENEISWISGLPVSTNSNTGRFGDTAVRLISGINNFCFFTNGGGMNNPEGTIELNSKTNELTIDTRQIYPWPSQNNQSLYLRRLFKGKKIK
jgi:hypothetical protein